MHSRDRLQTPYRLSSSSANKLLNYTRANNKNKNKNSAFSNETGHLPSNAITIASSSSPLFLRVTAALLSGMISVNGSPVPFVFNFFVGTMEVLLSMPK